MPRTDLIKRPQPFMALLLVAGGWALSHQLGSDSVFDDCLSRGGPFVVLASVVGLVITAAGAIYAAASWRAPEESGRSFLAVITMLLAPIAGFAMVMQLAAGLILPRCAA
ncbi:MAG TPA: hypothetical protein VN627_00265 [Novosphingobium sp.]|jgi:hypothetical protein|nr:hypothetical protein [Novosphingobium sp.]